MNVLLIGKIPPCQGGVASKFHWLFSALSEKYDFRFQAITIAKKPYVTPTPENAVQNVHVIDADNASIPWFIPKSDLFVDQMVSIALKLSSNTRFDLVICNYMEPYLAATFIISKILSLPYHVYPAGSDTHKFLTLQQTSKALAAYLEHADRIFLPVEKRKLFLQRMPSIPERRVWQVKRYVPDPTIFSWHPPQGNSLLFCGKINKFWRLRGIEKLAALLNRFPSLTLKCIIQGSYCEEFKQELNQLVSSADKRIDYLEQFISPAEMPREIATSIGVWNYLAEGGIVDFPNVHWETLYSGRFSFCSHFLLNQPDSQTQESVFEAQTIDADEPNWLESFQTAQSAASSLVPPDCLSQNFTDYISASFKACQLEDG